MKNSKLTIQQGISLIEVLIATVVIAIGLLAIATLQTQFMSSSGDNKIRSEALTLAEQKAEDFRNNIDKTAYVAIAENTVSDTRIGTNTVFTRTWTITNTAGFIATAPNRKNISVQVSWDSDGGIDSDNADADGDGTTGIIDDNERVNVVTEIAWINPADSALLASLNGGGTTVSVPSPRQNASEDVASENVIGDNMAITDLDATITGTAGFDATLGASAADPENDGSFIVITLTQIAPNSHYYTATRDTSNAVLNQIEEGVIAVFICADLDSDTTTADVCRHIQNHFGGVVHRIMGTAYSTSGNGFDDIRVAWTSSEINACYNGTPNTSANPNTMAYECVFAGNCDSTADAVNGCFPDSIVSDNQIEARHVGPGGEFGDVGLLGVNDSGGAGTSREQICFLEDTGSLTSSINPLLVASGSEVLNEDYLLAVTKRFYVTRGFDASNKQRSEGINRSYTNHNFLVIARGNGASANEKCKTEAASLQLPSRDIVRVINSNGDNLAQTETEYNGNAGESLTIKGTIDTDNDTNLHLYIPEQGTCYINRDTGTDYACSIANGTTDLTSGATFTNAVYGVSDEHPSSAGTYTTCSQSITYDPVTPATPSSCNWTADFN